MTDNMQLIVKTSYFLLKTNLFRCVYANAALCVQFVLTLSTPVQLTVHGSCRSHRFRKAPKSSLIFVTSCTASHNARTVH